MARRRPPNQYRCLAGMLFAMMAIGAAVGLHTFESALCALMLSKAPAVQCAIVPSAAFNLMLLASAGGLMMTLYRAYRDFYKGDYYLEMAERGYL